MDYQDSTKQCRTCGSVKTFADFYSRQTQCKECVKAHFKQKRASASVEQREKARLWRLEYKRQKRRLEGTPTAQELKLLRANNKAWASMVSFLRTKPIYPLPTLTSAERFRRRYRRDPAFRAKQIIRATMRKAAKKYGWIAEDLAYAAKHSSKTSRIWGILGYSANELIAHLQRQFNNGMTMDHFMCGEIHIDHIIPKSKFNLDSLEEVRACHALYNLRPMWAKDNIRKSNHVQHLL